MAARAPRWLIGVAATAGLAVVIVSSVWESRARADVVESVGWVTQTLQVQRELGRTRTLLTDAETGQRGYVLTLDEVYLDPNERAIAAIPGALAQLRQLVADNPGQQRRLAPLDPLVTAKIAELGETIAKAKSGDRDRAMAIVFDGHGNRLMSDIRWLVQSAVDDEERLLQERQGRLIDSIGRRTVAGLKGTGSRPTIPCWSLSATSAAVPLWTLAAALGVYREA